MIACKILGFVTMKILLWTFWASKIWGDNTLINHGWCFICSYHVIHELRAFMKTNHYFTSDMFRRAVGEHFKRLIGQYPTTMERSVGRSPKWMVYPCLPSTYSNSLGPLAPDFGRIPITTTCCSKGMGWQKYTKMHIPCNLIMGHWYRVIYIYIYMYAWNITTYPWARSMFGSYIDFWDWNETRWWAAWNACGTIFGRGIPHLDSLT